jgi:hypothetical protein
MPVHRRLNYFIVRDPLNGNSIFAVPWGWRLQRALAATGRVLPTRLHDAVERRLWTQLVEATRGYYGSSNRQLRELAGFDPEGYGYEMEPDDHRATE